MIQRKVSAMSYGEIRNITHIECFRHITKSCQRAVYGTKTIKHWLRSTTAFSSGFHLLL